MAFVNAVSAVPSPVVLALWRSKVVGFPDKHQTWILTLLYLEKGKGLTRAPFGSMSHR